MHSHVSRLLPLGLAFAAPAAMAQSTSYTLPGASAGDGFGTAVATVGDVDLDGTDDLVVGSPNFDAFGAERGRAAVYSGRDRSVIHSWIGGAALEQFGAAVAAAGDVDHDGHPDVIVGAPGAKQNGVALGKAVVYSGANGTVLRVFWGEEPDGFFGAAVTGAGDFDHDGRADVAVGAPRASLVDPYDPSHVYAEAGVVRLYSGATGQMLGRTSSWHFAGHFGGVLAPLGNDAWGYPQLGIGAPRHGATGRAFVWSGLFLDELFGPASTQRFGSSLCRIADTNGDGVDDYAVGSPGDDEFGTDSGRVHIVSGATRTTLAWISGTAGDAFGTSVAAAGDRDGDGHEDLLIGASKGAAGLLGRYGKAVLVRTDGTLLQSFVGPCLDSLFGTSVAAGDFNGDGETDLAVGAPDDVPNGVGSGSARVVLMANAAGSPYCFGDGSDTPCPCSSSAPGSRSGCPNSAGSSGKLVATGRASVANDDVQLRASGLPNTICLFFQGTSRVAAGEGAPYADGLRCAGGVVKRLSVRGTLWGTAIFPGTQDPALSLAGGAQPGETRHYQVWYRDPSSFFCTAGTSNFTNGYSIAWLP